MKFTMNRRFLVVIFLFVSENAVLPCIAGSSNDISNELENHTFLRQPDNEIQSCSQFTYLEIGVCKVNGYRPHVRPSRNQTIFVSMKHYNIHTVNDKTNTLSIDAELILYWTDSRIMTTFDEGDTEDLGYIPLSSKAIDKIWTPDIYVFNLSDYKSFVDSQHVSSVKVIPNFHSNFNFLRYFQSEDTIIEYKIEFRAPVYCQFDFTNYPKDKTSCRFIFGSQYSNIQYIIVDEGLNKNLIVTGLHRCELTLTNSSLLTSNTFKNSIGIEIEIERILRPFIYRYFLPCFGSVLVSSLTMTIPTNVLQARVGMSITLLLINVNLYVTQMVSNYILILSNNFSWEFEIIDSHNSFRMSKFIFYRMKFLHK